MVSIVALLSNEDKKSSSKDMGVRLPICGGVFRAAFSRVSCMSLITLENWPFHHIGVVDLLRPIIWM